MNPISWGSPILPYLVKQFETQVLLSLQHEREIEIWRIAVLMVNQHAQVAQASSFRHAEELFLERDYSGAAIRRLIIVAVEQLTDTSGGLN
jgi:hypothetical protein